LSRKPKPLPFKKGMKVVWINHNHGVSVTEGEVSLVTTRDGAQIVHVRHIDQFGNIWKRSFSTVAGMFQEYPFPIWQLRPMNGDNIENLKKRAEKATALYNKYQQEYQQIQRDVHSEAINWEYAEIAKRVKELPHNNAYIDRVKARMGFKRPEIVKVKVNGEISEVRRA